MTKLFESCRIGELVLRNRIAMAPMTRARNPDGIPNDLTALYYRQRATAGLIVAEGTPISRSGEGFLDIPGIYTSAQIQGWRGVTDAVHEEGGVIFAQLWHVGRVSHVSNQLDGVAPVSSTATVARNSQAWGINEKGEQGMVDASVPRALSTEEVRGVIRDFTRAAGHAMDARFDGIELHGANGYLIEQFLNPTVNDRMDEYRADTLENRCRFLLETVDAVSARIGAQRTAVRLSPFGGLFDMGAYDSVEETYLYLADQLSSRGLAYVHFMDQRSRGSSAIPEDFLVKFRRRYAGVVILAGGMDKARASAWLEAGTIDIAAFGEPFIANPDLVARLQNDWPLAKPDRALSYGGGARGYVDYPVHEPA